GCQVGRGGSSRAEPDRDGDAGLPAMVEPDPDLFQVGKGLRRLVGTEAPELPQCVVDDGRVSQDGAWGATCSRSRPRWPLLSRWRLGWRGEQLGWRHALKR